MNEPCRLIMVDEDSAHTSMFVTLLGDRIALDTKECKDSNNATRVLEEGFVPLVSLVDSSISGKLTALEFCKYLHESIPDCSIFLMSGGDRKSLVDAAREAGVKEVLQKPFDFQFGIETVTGASGQVRDALNSYLGGRLSGAQPCQEDDSPQEGTESDNDELLSLKREIAALHQKFTETQNKIAELEQKQYQRLPDDTSRVSP